jgi:hypothetical protein
MLRVHKGYLTLNSGANAHFCQLCLRHVIWRGALVGSRTSTTLKFLLSHTFRETWRTCRVLFNFVTSCFQKWMKCLLKKCANWPFYDTKSPDYRDQHMRVNAWEEIGKVLKIKRKTWRVDSVSPALVSCDSQVSACCCYSEAVHNADTDVPFVSQYSGRRVCFFNEHMRQGVCLPLLGQCCECFTSHQLIWDTNGLGLPLDVPLAVTFSSCEWIINSRKRTSQTFLWTIL